MTVKKVEKAGGGIAGKMCWRVMDTGEVQDFLDFVSEKLSDRS